jgi:hypothetical protein
MNTGFFTKNAFYFMDSRKYSRKGDLMRRPYSITCPQCGAHLDPGERCVCTRKARKRALAFLLSIVFFSRQETPSFSVKNPLLPRIRRPQIRTKQKSL